MLRAIDDGVYRLDTFVTGTRMPLALYLVDGGAGRGSGGKADRGADDGEDADVLREPSGGWLLTDTGCAGMVTELVLPALAALRPGAVIGTGVICHAHADHFGGNAELVAANPDCRLLAHPDDLAWARDPAWHVSDSYSALEPDFVLSPEARAWLFGLLGPPAPVAALEAGARLRVGTASFEVLHLPGHSPGHIGLWDGERRLLLASDAILGDGQYADGRRSAIPSYLDVGWYLGSIETIRALKPRILATAHFAELRDHEVQAFCDLSEGFVRQLGAAVLAALSDEPRRLPEVTRRALERVAPEVEPSIAAALSVRAHLRSLEGGGEARQEPASDENGVATVAWAWA